ncbi:MAG: hypothetical protein AB7J46_04950 [Candidatus Altimarinota bacterium]
MMVLSSPGQEHENGHVIGKSMNEQQDLCLDNAPHQLQLLLRSQSVHGD